jgi:hypothetical protein
VKWIIVGFLVWLVGVGIWLVSSQRAFAEPCDDYCALSPVTVSPLGLYRKNLERWQSVLDEYQLPGGSWLGVIEGNGAVDFRHFNKQRDALIYVPHITDRGKEITMVLWFHGHSGFRLDSNRVVNSIKNLDNLGKNYVLVIPEMPWSINTSTRRKRNHWAWNTKRSEHENLELFYENVSKILHNEFKVRVSHTIVIGHSAGGSAIKMAAKMGNLDVIRPKKIVFSDAGYGAWTDGAWKWHVRSHKNCEFILLVRKGDRPYMNTLRFLRKFKKKVPKNIILKIFPRREWTHRRIGDSSMFMDVVWR